MLKCVHIAVSSAVAVAIVCLSGCGGAPAQNRAPVEGEVSFDGKPLAKGTVTFTPEKQGTSGSGDIVDGQFKIAADRGPSPGPCRVEIVSYQETGKMIPGPGPGGKVAEAKQIIPLKYNAKTELKESVEAGKRLRFDLKK
jgi:hypothetical protein